MYKMHMKRIIDFVLAFILILVLIPLFIVLYFLIKLKLGNSVIFKQKRPGLNEKIFVLYKFRTMTDEKDQNGKLLADEKRLTKFGKLLRNTSLDELPELINILKGDMSFIGPRPLLIEYLPLYNKQQRERHLVRPGLTGLAQINGRNAISWKEKFHLDIQYIYQLNFFLDLKIFILTFFKVFKREGINSETSSTMEKFQGE